MLEKYAYMLAMLVTGDAAHFASGGEMDANTVKCMEKTACRLTNTDAEHLN